MLLLWKRKKIDNESVKEEKNERQDRMKRQTRRKERHSFLFHSSLDATSILIYRQSFVLCILTQRNNKQKWRRSILKASDSWDLFLRLSLPSFRFFTLFFLSFRSSTTYILYKMTAIRMLQRKLEERNVSSVVILQLVKPLSSFFFARLLMLLVLTFAHTTATFFHAKDDEDKNSWSRKDSRQWFGEKMR